MKAYLDLGTPYPDLGRHLVRVWVGLDQDTTIAETLTDLYIYIYIERERGDESRNRRGSNLRKRERERE